MKHDNTVSSMSTALVTWSRQAMCVAFWFQALGLQPPEDPVEAEIAKRFSLIIASNRDEFVTRPTLRPHVWPSSPSNHDLIAGRDLQAGGTWLGVSTPRGASSSGTIRFGVLTNHRSPHDELTDHAVARPNEDLSRRLVALGTVVIVSSFSQKVRHMTKLRCVTAAGGLALTVAGLLLVMRRGKRRKVSRGTLVGDYLQSSRKPDTYARTVQKEHASYAGFNLVVGDTRDGVFYVSNRREPRLQPLTNGVWAVANSTLEVPWEKLTRGKHLFRSTLHDVVQGCMGLDDDTLADLVADQLVSRVLKDTHQCEPGETGYPRQFEELLAKICIDPPVYPWHTIGVKEGEFANAFGTVCHIVVLVDREGVVRFYESSRGGGTGDWSERRKFVLPVTEEG